MKPWVPSFSASLSRGFPWTHSRSPFRFSSILECSQSMSAHLYFLLKMAYPKGPKGSAYPEAAPNSIASILAQCVALVCFFKAVRSCSSVKRRVPQSVWWTMAISSSLTSASRIRISRRAWRMFPPAFRWTTTSGNMWMNCLLVAPLAWMISRTSCF